MTPSRQERNQQVRALLKVLDAHAPGEEAHAERVAIYAVAIGEALHLDDEDLLTLRYAATLHDIGKVRVDRSIVRKLGRLDEDELRRVRLHAALAEEAVTAFDWLVPTLPIIRHHHERWDGLGYPDGIAGEAIPLGARIVNLAETFDVLMTRQASSAVMESRAVEEIAACSGTQFDPSVVEAFLQVQPRVQLMVLDSGLPVD